MPGTDEWQNRPYQQENRQETEGPSQGAADGGQMQAADVGPPPATHAGGTRRRGPGPTAVLLAVLVVVVIALGGLCWALWTTLASADQALTSAVNSVAAVAGAGAEAARLSQTIARVRAHQYDQVVRDLQDMLARLQAAEKPAQQTTPAQLPPTVPPSARPEIPPEAAQFFESRPELMRRLVAMAAAARKLRDQGVNVEPLRKLRDRILQAAAAGDEAKVRRLTDEFGRRLDQMGAPRPQRTRRAAGPPQLPGRIKKKLQALRSALEKAARQGRDVRKAVRLARRSEQAAQAGNMRQAEELLDQALKAAKRAPKLHRPPRQPARRPPQGPRGPNPLRVLDMLIGMVRAEEVDLSNAYRAMEDAAVAVREKNQSQIREILLRGIHALDRLAKRRRQVSLAIEGGPGPGRRPTRGGAPARRPGPEPPQPPDHATIADRLVAFLEQVRKMPEEEFQASKGRLAAIVFSLFLPPKPQPNRPVTDQEAVERVRRKLRLAAGPYLQRKMAGEDVSELDALFARARQALYGGKVQLADELVDQALQKLGLLLPSEQQPETAGADNQPAQQAAGADEALTSPEAPAAHGETVSPAHRSPGADPLPDR